MTTTRIKTLAVTAALSAPLWLPSVASATYGKGRHR